VQAYWAKEVFRLLASCHDEWDWLPHHNLRFNTREALLEGIGIPAGREYNILRLCPTGQLSQTVDQESSRLWIAGLETTTTSLREHGANAFPAHSPQEMQALTTHEDGPPVVPEPVAAGPPDAPELSWINLPPDQLPFRNIRLEKAATGAQNNRSVVDR
jgi:hypothetical protein